MIRKARRPARRSPRVIAVAVLVVAFSAGILALAAPGAAARASAARVSAPGGLAAPGTAPSLPPNVKRVCPWPPASGNVACLALRRTDISPHLGLFPDSAPPGYGPASLRAAYHLSTSSGRGITVAIVDAYDDPNAAADLATYRSQYGLPACTTGNGCFKKVNETGQASGYPSPDPYWGLEESLDIEMVSAVCPSCRILLVEANAATFIDLAKSVNTAVALGASYVSNSYGTLESSIESRYQSYYTHPGVGITVAAGDDGYGPEYPASFPQVVSVGGTSLLPASNSRGWDEIVWTGTGSGCSAYFSKAGWQTDSGCSRRTDNDVAAVADPETGVAVYDSFGAGGWNVIGGTSVSSPVIAGVYGLGGRPAAGTYPGSYLYSSSTGAYYDIVGGTNDLSGNCNPTYLCNGQPGYDGPSGWGTPNGVGAFEAPANYVAMGDSYSSGEGNPPYYPGSDTRTDKCHRSTVGYPALVKLPGQPFPIAQQARAGGNDKFAFVACTGAKTVGMTAKAVDNPPTRYDQAGNTDWGAIQSPLAEPLQIDGNPGLLSAATTLSSLSIGGNDARFSDVLFGCLTTKGDCIDNNFYLIRHSNGKKDPEPLNKFEPTVISELLPQHLEAVYEEIHRLAPNAKIVVVGYPLLFRSGTTTSCTVGTILTHPFTLNAQDQDWLNQMGRLLNSTISSTVSMERSAHGINIHFVDPTSAFSSHELCSSDPWIYSLSGKLSVSGGLSIVNPQSFHPTKAGQQAYADLVNGCLAGTVSC